MAATGAVGFDKIADVGATDAKGNEGGVGRDIGKGGILLYFNPETCGKGLEDNIVLVDLVAGGCNDVHGVIHPLYIRQVLGFCKCGRSGGMDVTLADIVETLGLLPDWEQRFQYIIELADILPVMDEGLKTEERRVRGCTSRVWMEAEWEEDGRLRLVLDSDAVLVRGLLAVVWVAHAGKTKAELAGFDFFKAVEGTGLVGSLSPNRRSGLASVVARVGGMV